MAACGQRLCASRAAAVWWMRLRSGKLSRKERDQFVHWLRASPIHLTEMLLLAKVDRALAQRRSWEQIDIHR